MVGTCGRGHEWTAENTYRSPTGKRSCRACRALWRKSPRGDRGPNALNGKYAQKARYVPVTCPGCGDSRVLTERNARKIREGVHSGLCERCRFAPKVEVTEDLKRWWLQRFTPNEIFVMASWLLSTEDEPHDTVAVPAYEEAA